MQNIASKGGLITLFVLVQFVLGGGPNITTFLNPVEVFPTRVRGSGHGISAAAGKAGAVVTAFSFGNITQAFGLRGALGFFSAVMGLVALATLWIPEVKNMTLEEIEAGVMYGGDIWDVEPRNASSEPSVLASDLDSKTVEPKITAISSP